MPHRANRTNRTNHRAPDLPPGGPPDPWWARTDLGQTTAEYALVLLGAATVALLLVAWATGSGKIDQLFNAVFDHLIHKAR